MVSLTHLSKAPARLVMMLLGCMSCTATKSISRPEPLVQCTAGSEDLCSCSELIKLGAIKSFDDCTQEAAIAYCKAHGECPEQANLDDSENKALDYASNTTPFWATAANVSEDSVFTSNRGITVGASHIRKLGSVLHAEPPMQFVSNIPSAVGATWDKSKCLSWQFILTGMLGVYVAAIIVDAYKAHKIKNKPSFADDPRLAYMYKSRQAQTQMQTVQV